jgi:hypothetical protein
MKPLGLKKGTHVHCSRFIDVQNRNSNAAHGIEPDKVCSFPAKMVPPMLAAGMEKRRQVAGERIEPRDIGPLNVLQ